MSTHHGILLHVIFSTKYRKPYLADAWRDDLFAYIGGVVKDHKSTLLKSGGVEDHVHLFLKIHPEFAISKTVQLLKANSSRWINGDNLERESQENATTRTRRVAKRRQVLERRGTPDCYATSMKIQRLPSLRDSGLTPPRPPGTCVPGYHLPSLRDSEN